MLQGPWRAVVTCDLSLHRSTRYPDIYNGTMATDEVSFEEVRQTLITSSWQRCSVTLSVSSVYAMRTTA
ncbi:unnamed protein product [Boreogadus saida]